MKYLRGDIVLLDFPFNDGTGAKRRPAVVLQADEYNRKLTSVVVAMFTSNLARANVEPAQLLVDPGTVEGASSGLRVPSALTCTNIFTVHESSIVKKIGELSPSLLTSLDDCLKAALGIS